MEFPPVEVEDVKFIFRLAKSTADLIDRLCHRFKEPDNEEPGENEDRKDSIKQAIAMLTRETHAKKLPYLEKFVERTLLDPKCELEPATVFCVLKDLEQMTWRQLCLMEGFRRKGDNEIEVSGYDFSEDVNGYIRGTEMKKLIDIHYLYTPKYSTEHFSGSSFEEISIGKLGRRFLELLDLRSIELSEIGKAFGEGKVKATFTY